jgi:hypothetical protein
MPGRPGCPSVTEVTGRYQDFSGVNPAVLEAAADRGTLFHSYAAGYLSGKWMPKPPPEIQGFFDSFRRWCDLALDAVLMVEFELICSCPGYGYCGHVDAVIVMRGETSATLIDWKTPIAENRKAWTLQVAGGYWHLAERHGALSINLSRCGAVQVKRDGKPATMRAYEGSTLEAQAVFFSALQVHKYFNGGQ